MRYDETLFNPHVILRYGIKTDPNQVTKPNTKNNTPIMKRYLNRCRSCSDGTTTIDSELFIVYNSVSSAFLTLPLASNSALALS